MGMQTRVNLLAVFAIGAVLLNGLSRLDVQSAIAEKVTLEGILQEQPVLLLLKDIDQLSWVLSSILAATPADTAMLLLATTDTTWEPAAFVGVVPPNLLLSSSPGDKVMQLPDVTPILDRFRKDSGVQESYLPTLQALPGKRELVDYFLPVNTQAALLLPVRIKGLTAVLLLGSNQARSFTPRDIAWCQSVVTRLE
jgi:hypothetical protein